MRFSSFEHMKKFIKDDPKALEVVLLFAPLQVEGGEFSGYYTPEQCGCQSAEVALHVDFEKDTFRFLEGCGEPVEGKWADFKVSAEVAENPEKIEEMQDVLQKQAMQEALDVVQEEAAGGIREGDS